MKALVVRLSSIGDVVHTLPAFVALRRAGHEVGWVVEPAGRELLVGQEALSQVLAVPSAGGMGMRAVRETRASLRAAHYDVALDFQGLWKSAFWARASGARDVLGFDGTGRKEPASRILLRRTVPPAPEAVHVIDKYLALLRGLEIEAVGLREFPLPSASHGEAASRLRALGVDARPFAVLNPGGGWSSKVWPAERFGALARRLRDRGLSSVVTWGPSDGALADRVVSASNGTAVRCFPTTLLEFAAVAREARLVVAADTGPLHIACAVRTPVVGLFGPTDPARNGPFDAADVVVSRRPACFPCYRRSCPRHQGVMDAISVDEVAVACDARLRIAPDP